MRSTCRLIAPLLALVALAFAVLACNGGAETGGLAGVPLPENGSGGVYLALGDSVAAGSGASDAASTSYVALVAGALRSRFGDALELDSLAVPGHTTQDLIDDQLPAAVERLREGDVRLVTLTIGGNDLNQYGVHPACVRDPSDPACPLEDGLLEVERRLSLIFEELREAGPEATIVTQAYPNLFSGTAHQFEWSAETAFDLLNGVITGVARRHGVLVADPRRAFVGEGGELTHLLDPAPDAHPNDAGYRVIAVAFLEVLGISTADAGED
jgi:lysophospholipase L1-like esterase